MVLGDRRHEGEENKALERERWRWWFTRLLLFHVGGYGILARLFVFQVVAASRSTQEKFGISPFSRHDESSGFFFYLFTFIFYFFVLYFIFIWIFWSKDSDSSCDTLPFQTAWQPFYDPRTVIKARKPERLSFVRGQSDTEYVSPSCLQ